MLEEIFMMPEILLNKSHFLSEEDFYKVLKLLKKPLQEELILRDSKDGKWRSFLKENLENLPHKRKEVAKLILGMRKSNPKRIRNSKMILETELPNSENWLSAALSSHREDPLAAIFTATESFLETTCEEKDLIVPIKDLAISKWWDNRSSTKRIDRKIEVYKKYLKKLFEKSNSLMFIDPHLAPSKQHYSKFFEILALAKDRDTENHDIEIEIHRACTFEEKILTKPDEWKDVFCSLNEKLKEFNLNVTIFIWDRFHDRYLISDLLGIAMQNGFDASGKENDKTTWSRLSRIDRDDVQREFEEGTGIHKLHCKFELPF
jgi:hypothetical protein